MRTTSVFAAFAVVATAMLGMSAGVANAAQVTPDSHSGCNGNTCIDVTGTGLKVQSWGAELKSGDGCGKPNYYENGHLYYAGQHTYCPGTWAWAPGMPKTFANNTELCVDFVPYGEGTPCATVHS